jgi:chromosome transmission fidelity protein 8
LEGKIVNLPKPLAILQRTCVPPTPPPSADENGGDIDGDVDMRHSGNSCQTKDDNDNKSTPPTATATATATSYAIQTLVRKKIIFSKRPTPMVGLSASAKTT